MEFITKKFVKRLVYIKILNVLLRQLVKPFSSLISENILRRIPVVGRISLDLQDSKKLYLVTDGDDIVSSVLYWKGINFYEKSTIKLFKELLKYTDNIFDIGANIGIYALIASINNPRRMVYAFEPVPRTFDCLKRNVNVNKMSNLKIYPYAITNYDGEISMFIPFGSVPTDASTLRGFRDVPEEISVPCITIDSFVAKNNISRVDLMKIDTEATEHFVLEGAKKTIERDEPIVICEVLKGRTENCLNSLLKESGYKYFWITDSGLIEKKKIEGDSTYKNTDYLFITDEKLREVSKKIDI